MELNPATAYRLLAIPQHELRNVILPFSELVGPLDARFLEERMQLASEPEQKAVLLQRYLTVALERTERDAIFERCAAAIMNAQGRISIAALSSKSGWSDRWLRAKFAERLGLSPRTFALICRFQSSFQALLRDKNEFLLGKSFQDSYYDQAHFIKVFKRFMGRSPAQYSSLQNEVGEIIYLNGK